MCHFLGKGVLELAAHIPHRLKHPARNRGKMLLRKMLREYLPDEITERGKLGFGIPLDTSLNLQKRQAIESMLTSPEARIRPLIDAEFARSVCRAFVAGRRSEFRWSRFVIYQNVYMLWSLERWLQKWDPAHVTGMRTDPMSADNQSTKSPGRRGRCAYCGFRPSQRSKRR